MKRNIIITILLLIILLNINIIINTTLNSLTIFITKVFISIFPFMILSEILFYYDYHIFISKSIIGKFISKLFNIDRELSIIFILSILTSTPNNSIYIKKLLDNNEIDIKDAEKLLLSSFFPSISFTIGTIGFILYNNIKIGIIIYLSCIINNILIGIYLRKDKTKYICKTNINKNTLINTIKESIITSINNIYIIMGLFILFSIIISLLSKYIKNEYIILVVSSILEMTNGINLIYNLNIDLNIKIILTIFTVNFSGLSIIIQNISILSKYKLNIKKILIIKLIFSFILSIVCILLMKMVL